MRLMPPSCRPGQIGASSCIRSEEERLQYACLTWRVGAWDAAPHTCLDRRPLRTCRFQIHSALAMLGTSATGDRSRQRRSRFEKGVAEWPNHKAVNRGTLPRPRHRSARCSPSVRTSTASSPQTSPLKHEAEQWGEKKLTRRTENGYGKYGRTVQQVRYSVQLESRKQTGLLVLADWPAKRGGVN